MRMEVRCCCVPKKLLGWLEVEPQRNRIEFPICEAIDWKSPSDFCKDVKRISLPIVIINNEGRSYPAIKSEETPIETLRKIPGFIENI